MFSVWANSGENQFNWNAKLVLVRQVPRRKISTHLLGSWKFIWNCDILEDVYLFGSETAHIVGCESKTPIMCFRCCCCYLVAGNFKLVLPSIVTFLMANAFCSCVELRVSAVLLPFFPLICQFSRFAFSHSVSCLATHTFCLFPFFRIIACMLFVQFGRFKPNTVHI